MSDLKKAIETYNMKDFGFSTINHLSVEAKDTAKAIFKRGRPHFSVASFEGLYRAGMYTH